MANEVRPGTPDAAIVADEERLLARVQARIALGDGGERDRVGSAQIDEELVALRDQVGEAKLEDLAPLVEQMTRLAALRARLGGSRTLPVDPKSPYFAHMTLRQRGKRRDVMVGKRGFIDRKSNVQIVDWRNAPVSRIYYRYEEGDDYEEEIAGRHVEGVVEVRRNLSIAAGRLRRIGSPQGAFVRDARGVWHRAAGQAVPVLKGGAGTAARVPKTPRRGSRDRTLGVHHGPVYRADKHLPEIAALIDRAQFDLITQPESGLVVVEGGAGSGKTTVALHRIAYLTFAAPKRFRPRRLLFVVPSEALVRYVSEVLPSLGVQGVPVTTYASWAKTTRRRLLRGSSGKYNTDIPDGVRRLKKHPALLAILADYAADQEAAAGAALGDALARTGGATILAQWQHGAGRALVPRLQSLHNWLRSSAGTELPPASRAAAESAAARLARRARQIEADWAEVLTDAARLGAGFAGCSDVSRRDIDALVAWCSRQMARHGEGATDVDGAPLDAVDGRSLDEDDPAGRYDPEDDPILLRLIQLKRGGLVGDGGGEIRYEHVAIDEAQDRSALEVKVLLEAATAAAGDPMKASVTIAGDRAQRLVFDNGFTSWGGLLEQTGYAASLVQPLRLSYRSTAEVMELARDILGPGLRPSEPLVARPGAPVELYQVGDIGEAVALLADALRGLIHREPTASVALVARFPEQAEAYYQGLARADVPALRRVRRQDFSFSPGIDVTDVAQVKGLEFDYVVLLEVNRSSYGDNLESRHLLHIGATRAAHQLWLVATDEVSPLLPASLRAPLAEEAGVAPPPR